MRTLKTMKPPRQSILRPGDEKPKIDYDRLLYLELTDDYNDYGLSEKLRSFKIFASGRGKET